MFSFVLLRALLVDQAVDYTMRLNGAEM